MPVASLDSNGKPVLIALGSDGSTIVEIYADTSTNRLYTNSVISSGSVGHDITGIASGTRTVTTAGTAVTLTAATTTAKKVTIQASANNTGIIAIGGSTVDATTAPVVGIFLYATQSVTIECDDLVDIYIDASVSGETVSYTYFT